MLEIIPAGREHLPQIMKIERESFSDPWSESGFEAELGEDSCFIVAKDGDAVLGYAVLRMIGDECELFNIAVDASLRGMGTGGALLEAVLFYAKMHGAVQIWLEVRESNEPAIKLYEKYGFSSVGIRKNYYTDPVENAVLMGREIDR